MLAQATYGFYDDVGHLYNVNIDIQMSEKYYQDLKEVLKIKKTNIPFIRIGNPHLDGGYIMTNDFKGNIAYSFGIDKDITWDAQMVEKGYDVFMYDPTVDFSCENPKLHFFKEGIAGHDSDQFKTLKTFLDRNNHSGKNMILKMDVEGAEWDFLNTVDEKTLNRFDQIVMELHGIISTSLPEKVIELISKLNRTHSLVHIHGNNTTATLKIGNIIYHDCIEVTYIKGETYDGEVILPISIDIPNDIGRKDVYIGNWNS